MEEIKAFKASDGSLFPTKELCLQHEENCAFNDFCSEFDNLVEFSEEGAGYYVNIEKFKTMLCNYSNKQMLKFAEKMGE